MTVLYPVKHTLGNIYGNAMLLSAIAFSMLETGMHGSPTDFYGVYQPARTTGGKIYHVTWTNHGSNARSCTKVMMPPVQKKRAVLMLAIRSMCSELRLKTGNTYFNLLHRPTRMPTNCGTRRNATRSKREHRWFNYWPNNVKRFASTKSTNNFALSLGAMFCSICRRLDTI